MRIHVFLIKEIYVVKKQNVLLLVL